MRAYGRAGVLYACKGVSTLFTGLRDKEGERGEREREKEIGVKEKEREREREGEREGDR